MSTRWPTCYVDAAGWSEVITVTLTYDYTSPDGRTTKTGTATFTYHRVRLGDLLAAPKLLFGDDPATLSVGQGKFLAVQSAIGQLPGWIVVFGPQDPQADAFTTTVQPPDPDGDPSISHSDAYCTVSARCTLTAPGLRIGRGFGGELEGEASENVFLGINAGLSYGEHVDAAAYDVTLLSPGVPADAAKKQAAIGPVYRVTIPADAGIIDDSGLTIIANGTTYTLSNPDGNTVDVALAELLSLLPPAIATGDNQAVVESRTPWVCEVQLPHASDTLVAGTLSYSKFALPDSTVTFGGAAAQTIDDPFPMAGQRFDTDADDSGFSATIQF